MDQDTSSGTQPWRSLRGQAAGLIDLTGDMKLTIANQPAGLLHVEHGTVFIEPSGDATALLAVDSERTLLGVLGGDVHPFVAYLQGRLQVEGDRALALRILFGLRAGSPWSSVGKAQAA